MHKHISVVCVGGKEISIGVHSVVDFTFLTKAMSEVKRGLIYLPTERGGFWLNMGEVQLLVFVDHEHEAGEEP